MAGLKQDYWQNDADAAYIDRAVKLAHACYESGVLSSTRPVERGRMVCGMVDHLLANCEKIAEG